MNEILISAIVSLSGAVAFLYRQQAANFKDVRRKLAECESDRRDLFERLIKLTREVAKLRGEKVD